MIPYSNPEFWLSLSFLIVAGLVIFPPVRQRIRTFFNGQRQKIEKDIQESDNIYQKALSDYKTLQTELKSKLVDKDLSGKIKKIQHLFEEKTENQIALKKQNIKIQQDLIGAQMKNNLRSDLLDGVQEKISKSAYPKRTSSKEIQHFLKVLHENEEQLQISLKH